MCRTNVIVRNPENVFIWQVLIIVLLWPVGQIGGWSQYAVGRASYIAPVHLSTARGNTDKPGILVIVKWFYFDLLIFKMYQNEMWKGYTDLLSFIKYCIYAHTETHAWHVHVVRTCLHTHTHTHTHSLTQSLTHSLTHTHTHTHTHAQHSAKINKNYIIC